MRPLAHLLLLSLLLVSACGRDEAPPTVAAGELFEDGGTGDAGAPPAPCGCVAGEGPYCEARARAAAEDAGCLLPVFSTDGGALLACEGEAWRVLEGCGGGCSFTPDSPKPDDACELPECECFVQVAWCGSGAAKEAASRGCRIPLLPEHDGAILHCPGGAWAVKQACADGCVEQPPGTPDNCRSMSTYKLPFACGVSRRCSSGNHTTNHTGKDAYAYDFAMPVGSSVRALRAGTVLRTRLPSPAGSPCHDGGGSSCANYANTVEVKHADGTVGLYMHLSSIAVAKGAAVAQGEVLGDSGNSGWSTGPHLHVQVQSDCGIWWCQSVPFTFQEGAVATGTTLSSGNCP
jgi:hypothetical protein